MQAHHEKQYSEQRGLGSKFSTGSALFILATCFLLPTQAQSYTQQLILSDGATHTFTDDTYADYRILVRNVGCPSNANPCPSPGAPTTLHLLGSAIVEEVHALDSSSVTVGADASITNNIVGKGTGQMTIEGGGSVGGCSVHEASSFTLNGENASCGTLSQYGSGHISILRGAINTLARISSTATLSGGSIGGDLSAVDSAVVQLSGTSITYNLQVMDSATVTWSGGTVGFTLVSNGAASQLIIQGQEFQNQVYAMPFRTVLPYGKLRLGEGTLIGKLANGDPINNSFRANGFDARDGTIELVQSPTPPPSAEIPFDIHDTTRRLVRIEIENSEDPLIRGSDAEASWDDQLTRYGTWVSDGSTGFVAHSENYLISWYPLRYADTLFGFTNDVEFVFDIASGNMSSHFAETIAVEGEEPAQSDVTTLPGPWARGATGTYPGEVAGFDLIEVPGGNKYTLHPFCSDAFSTTAGVCGQYNPASPYVQTYPYDDATGLVNATGPIEINDEPLFETGGDLRLTEVDVTLGAPFDITDPTPRLIAIEVENSEHPSVVGTDIDAQWAPPYFTYWHSIADSGFGQIYTAGRYLEHALSQAGLNPVPGSFEQFLTTINTTTGHIYRSRADGDLAGGGTYISYETTSEHFLQADFRYNGDIVGYITVPSGIPSVNNYLFCTEDTELYPSGGYNPLWGGLGCHAAGSNVDPPRPWGIVDAYPYDPATGLVNATGGIQLTGANDVTLFSKAGDQRWSEVLINVPEPGPALLQGMALLTLFGLVKARRGVGKRRPLFSTTDKYLEFKWSTQQTCFARSPRIAVA